MTLSFRAHTTSLHDSQQLRSRKYAAVLSRAALFFSAFALVACASPTINNAGVDASNQNLLRARAAASQPKQAVVGSNDLSNTQSAKPQRDSMQLGTGEMFRGAPSIGGPATGGDRSVSLNFENGDIREITRNILGDLLGENFMIDPRVTGTVSIRTPKGVQRSELLPIFETLLRQVNASLVRDGLLWRVVPATEAVQGIQRPRIGFTANDGSAVQIYTVKHIGAKELQRVMLPFAKGGEAAVRVDELRNIIYLAGTETEIKRLLEIASMFDIDILAGMSFLVYTLQSADVKAVMADWERVFPAASNPFAGLLRVVPIERMNGILLVSPQSEVIVQARSWIEKLDKGADAGGGARLYVYNLQFSYAEKLQPLLQAALTGRTASTNAASVAPGQTPSTIGAPPTAVAGQPNILPGNSAGQTPTASTPGPRTATGQQGAAAANASAIGLARNATVTADKDRNALLIVATPAEYAAIESVLKRLDTPPKQIAIEVQLAEVSLTGDFQFGLQTFFQGHLNGAQNRLSSADGSGSISLPTGGASSVFAYTWKKSDAIKAILSLSESKNQVRTLAQPTLITLDNQKASFNSGKQISVRTQTQSSTTTTGTVDSFQYINTGISLNVTPRVSGESVILEIQQEISDAAPSAGANPDISKSATSTTVMVQSGDTMLIGGLFSNKSSTASGGLPFASSIPVIGGLFGNQRWASDRSEIALLITPRILGDIEETRSVVDDLRSKLVGIEALLPDASTSRRPSSAEAKQALRALMQQSSSTVDDRSDLPKNGALREFAHSLRVDKTPPASPSQ